MSQLLVDPAHIYQDKIYETKMIARYFPNKESIQHKERQLFLVYQQDLPIFYNLSVDNDGGGFHYI